MNIKVVLLSLTCMSSCIVAHLLITNAPNPINSTSHIVPQQTVSEAIKEAQKAVKTEVIQKLFQNTYDALSIEHKESYTRWGNDRRLNPSSFTFYMLLAHWAASNGHAECLEKLKNGGANFNVQDNYLYTPAHWAAIRGQTTCLEILKAGGAHFRAYPIILNTSQHETR